MTLEGTGKKLLRKSRCYGALGRNDDGGGDGNNGSTIRKLVDVVKKIGMATVVRLLVTSEEIR